MVAVANIVFALVAIIGVVIDSAVAVAAFISAVYAIIGAVGDIDIADADNIRAVIDSAVAAVAAVAESIVATGVDLNANVWPVFAFFFGFSLNSLSLPVAVLF